MPSTESQIPVWFPAALAATAALFTAFTTFLVWRIQLRDSREAVRLELILSGWERQIVGEDNCTHELIHFNSIKNIGRGTALHINIVSSSRREHWPSGLMGNVRYPALGAGEEVDEVGSVVV